MKKLIIKVIGVILLVTFLIYPFYSLHLKFDVLENPNKNSRTTEIEQFKQVSKNAENPRPKEGTETWIGRDVKTLTRHYGQAGRSYLYKSGLKSYVSRQKDEYYTVSTNKETITPVYATGEGVEMSLLKIGESSSHISEDTGISPESTVGTKGGTHRFEMSGEDLRTQTLIKYGDIYAQIYSDQQTSEVLAVRLLNANTSATLQPYKLNRAEGCLLYTSPSPRDS